MNITVLCIFVFLFKGLKKKKVLSGTGLPSASGTRGWVQVGGAWVQVGGAWRRWAGRGAGGRGVFWLWTAECGSSDGFLMDSHARQTSGYSPKKCIL